MPAAFVLDDPTLMHHWYEPPWKMFQSNKLLLVALWRCFPGHENLLAAHPDGPGGLQEWVRKPVFGREGDGIEMHARGVRIRAEHPHSSPLDVWQALVYGVIMVLTILFMPFGLSGAIRRYAYRWLDIGVEPIIPRRLGH